MKTKPFLIATLVSTSLQCLYYLVVGGITLLLLPSMMETMQDMPSSGNPPPGFFNFIGLSMLTGGIALVLSPVVHAGTGALYAWLHRREEQPVTAEQGAIGGAAAAFTARFTTGLLVAVGSLIFSQMMYGMMGDAFTTMPGNGPSPFQDPAFSVFTGLSSVAGGLFSACLGSLIAAALGALGGSLTGAMLK